jgi:hypothetical protein
MDAARVQGALESTVEDGDCEPGKLAWAAPGGVHAARRAARTRLCVLHQLRGVGEGDTSAVPTS